MHLWFFTVVRCVLWRNVWLLASCNTWWYLGCWISIHNGSRRIPTSTARDHKPLRFSDHKTNRLSLIYGTHSDHAWTNGTGRSFWRRIINIVSPAYYYMVLVHCKSNRPQGSSSWTEHLLALTCNSIFARWWNLLKVLHLPAWLTS